MALRGRRGAHRDGHCYHRDSRLSQGIGRQAGLKSGCHTTVDRNFGTRNEC